MERSDNLFDMCPTDTSRKLLSLIVEEHIWDLEKLKARCSEDFINRVLLEALDDLIKYKVIVVVPSFRINKRNKWETYDKITLGVNNEQ